MKFVEHYLLYGIPCSGKGEHCKIIKANENENTQVIEMGQSFRDEIEEQTMMGRTIKDTVWSGDLLDDEYATEIIKRYSLETDTIFDGYPRTPNQSWEYIGVLAAMDICKYDVIPVAFDIVTKKDTAIERMKLRIKGAIARKAPVRKDDQLEILSHRIDLANTITHEAKEILRSKKIPILELNGESDILNNPIAYGHRVRDIRKFLEKSRYQHLL